MNIQDLPEQDPNGAFLTPRRIPDKAVIPITKTVTYEVPNGELHVKLEGDTYYVWYHNPLYKGSPFKLSVCFSTSFTMREIAESSEVISFVSRFE